MSDGLKAVAAIAFIGTVLAGVFWWHVYAYGDCRNVGHSRLYCIAHFLSN